MSLGISLIIILAFTIVGGLIMGSFGGSIGSTFRDLIAVITSEKRNKKFLN